MGDLDELRQLRDARRDRDRVALELARPSASVPHLVRGGERDQDVVREPELLAERARDPRVLGDHVVDLAVTRERELEPDAKAAQRRSPGAEPAHARGGPAQAPEPVLVLARLQRDVVTEPLGLLVRVGMAADVDQQRRVVHDGSLRLVQPGGLGEPKRDQALAQHMLHRLPEAQVDTERQGRDELGEPDVRAVRFAGHEAEATRTSVPARM